MISTFISSVAPAVKGKGSVADVYSDKTDDNYGIGEGLTFSEAKKTKMEKVTVEGADLAKEIAKKVNEDFDKKKLPDSMENEKYFNIRRMQSINLS